MSKLIREYNPATRRICSLDGSNLGGVVGDSEATELEIHVPEGFLLGKIPYIVFDVAPLGTTRYLYQNLYEVEGNTPESDVLTYRIPAAVTCSVARNTLSYYLAFAKPISEGSDTGMEKSLGDKLTVAPFLHMTDLHGGKVTGNVISLSDQILIYPSKPSDITQFPDAMAWIEYLKNNMLMSAELVEEPEPLILIKSYQGTECRILLGDAIRFFVNGGLKHMHDPEKGWLRIYTATQTPTDQGLPPKGDYYLKWSVGDDGLPNPIWDALDIGEVQELLDSLRSIEENFDSIGIPEETYKRWFE